MTDDQLMPLRRAAELFLEAEMQFFNEINHKTEK